MPLTKILGVKIIVPEIHNDARGSFRETYRASWPGLRGPMVQGNMSTSRAGVLRGLHYHLDQADLWHVPHGWVRAGLFDLRESSPTYGQAETHELDASNLLYIPPGVAHGFYAVVDSVLSYLVDRYYNGGADEHGLRWNDPLVRIDWQIDRPGGPILSERDAANPSLLELKAKP